MLYRIIKKHGPAYFFSKLIPGLIGMVAVPLFAQLYGLENYGKIMIFVAMGNAITVLTCGWLAQSWIRFQITWSDRSNLGQAILFALIAVMAICSIILLIMVVFTQYMLNNIFLYFSTTILMVLGMVLYYIIHAGLQAQFQSKDVLRISFLLSILCFGLPIISFYLNRGVTGFIFAYGLAYIAAALTGFYLYNKTTDSFESDSQEITTWFKYGFPLSIWLTFQASIPFLERLFIQNLLGPQQVGQYTALTELITRAFSLIIFPITLSIQPVMMKHWNQDKKDLVIQIWKQCISLLSVFMFASLCIYLLAHNMIINLISSMLNTTFHQPGILVGLMALSGFLWQANLILHKPLELSKETGKMVIIILIALAVISVAYVITVPIYGLVAAAGAACLGAMTYGLITYLYGNIIFRKSHALIQ